MLGIIRLGVISALFFLYPYLVYRGMDNGMVWLAPTVFAGIYVFRAFKSSKGQLIVGNIALAVILLAGAFFLQALTAKLLPVFIQLILMYFFGHTLFKGTPLIEHFVRFDYPELPDEVVLYARQLTLIWTGFFAFNALMCGVLALWATDLWWAIYNGILIYTLTAMLIIGEYIYRHFRFPGWEMPSFRMTLRNIIINGRTIWMNRYEQR